MDDLPKIAHTLRRGRTYYVRQRIPTDLLKSYDGKKEIVKSLGTDDPAQARKKVKIALLHIESEFEQKRRTNLPSAKGHKLDDLSDIEIVSMVIRWHQEHDKSNEETFLSESRPGDYQREEIIQTLLEEIGEEQRLLVEGTHYTKPIENLLQDKGIEFDSKSVAYSRLEDLLSRASIDLVTRTLQRYQGQAIIGINDPVFSQRPLTERETITFGQLCLMYEDNARNKGLKLRSMTALRAEIDLLKNFISPEADIKTITRKRCREILEALKTIPINASKMYSNISLLDAIEQGRKDHATTLSIRTINGHISRLSSLFKFAQDEMLLDTNPAANLALTDTVSAHSKRISFSTDNLNTIFSAPLYKGCVDDEYNYNKPGPKLPRRARFWVPLIALFSGMRMEEVCQLHARDIYSKNDVWVIKIHRSIKTKNSLRIVPVHPELIKIGFLGYVDTFRNKKNDHIFPNLVLGKEQNYSKNFSKWFANFLDNLSIDDPRLCYHSFRHTYRDALTQAQIPLQFVNALCGWSGKAMNEIYGTGVPEKLLYEQIQRVEYSGLDLSHLYQK